MNVLGLISGGRCESCSRQSELNSQPNVFSQTLLWLKWSGAANLIVSFYLCGRWDLGLWWCWTTTDDCSQTTWMCGKSNHWVKLLSHSVSFLSLSLSQLRNWYSTIKKSMISFIGNICLTGNILGSDLLRLIPRWRGGRLLVVFLSFRTSILFRFWSTCKAFSKAKTSIKGFRPKQAPINSGKNEWQKI